MLNKLATIAAATVLSFGALTGAAEAKPSSCWGGYDFQETLTHAPCNVIKYHADGAYNWDGPYFFIADFGRVFLNDRGIATVRLFDGTVINATWQYDSDGDIAIYNPAEGYTFVFRPVTY